MAQITPKKTAIVKSLQDLLSQSKSVAIVDYSGLKVSQATALRQAIRAAGGQYLVAKNTLFKIASGLKGLDLSGISGFVFSITDEVSAIKATADFAKKNSTPTFKLGILDNQLLTAQEVTQLSTIPDKQTLVAKLVNSLNSPISNLAYNLNWNISKLVRTLDAVSKQNHDITPKVPLLS